MKIAIESTEKLTRIGGVPCRVWNGVTETGIACELAIPIMRVHHEVNKAEFEAELIALNSLKDEAVDFRFIW